ncbi:hypothetical protein V1478_015214 [Vespula squamosa]|uniref:Uncharacterized protein n=1 Tax=Vespula squamosa TaxID=30214 RepID=A0ABD2A4G4_VESSQ
MYHYVHCTRSKKKIKCLPLKSIIISYNADIYACHRDYSDISEKVFVIKTNANLIGVLCFILKIMKYVSSIVTMMTYKVYFPKI